MLERFYILLAWALPRKLVYFCAWRVWASALIAGVDQRVDQRFCKPHAVGSIPTTGPNEFKLRTGVLAPPWHPCACFYEVI